MLAFATERGTLQPGMPVVEASSGSFGAALAVSCATTGHPCILVVPSNLPIAQRKRLQDLGAHIIACSSSGRRAMERVAEDTAKRYGGYYTHYFSNDDNPEYHRRVTGPQIYKNAGDAIDAIVIGVGSGGTITGVAEYIKAWNSMVRIVAVEPAECAAISGGFIGQHDVQPFQLSDCIKIELVRNQVIEHMRSYLQKHLKESRILMNFSQRRVSQKWSAI